jgi:hypothetical protein
MRLAIGRARQRSGPIPPGARRGIKAPDMSRRVGFTLVAATALPCLSCASVSGLDGYSVGPGGADAQVGRSGRGAEDAAPEQDGSMATDGAGADASSDDGSPGDDACPGAPCSAGYGEQPDCDGGSDAGDSAASGPRDGGAESSAEAGCVAASLPPSVNVDASQASRASKRCMPVKRRKRAPRV